MDKPTVQDIFRQFWDSYTECHHPSTRQWKTAYHIMNCKTGAFGANVSHCEKCGHMVYHNNSCGDRSCPMCQAVSNEIWIDAQNEYVLDTDYYHIVMTCPQELYPLMYCNQKEMYSLFFHAVSDTLKEMSLDPGHLGGLPGFLCVMHTWGSDLSYHPHIHVLITGGGLDKNHHWKEKKNGFFLPGKAMAKLFKGKFLAGLKELHDNRKLEYHGEAEQYRNYYHYKELLDICYRKNWVTDIRESFAGAETVMRYLGRYTHRIAISNSRIVSMDEKTVTFKVKDYKNGGVWKTLTLNGTEFIRRFLMHVPPKGFIRIRHYGLLCNHSKNQWIPLCRNLIGCLKFLSRFEGHDKPEIILKLYKKDITRCPCCGETMTYLGRKSVAQLAREVT